MNNTKFILLSKKTKCCIDPWKKKDPKRKNCAHWERSDLLPMVKKDPWRSHVHVHTLKKKVHTCKFTYGGPHVCGDYVYWTVDILSIAVLFYEAREVHCKVVWNTANSHRYIHCGHNCLKRTERRFS